MRITEDQFHDWHLDVSNTIPLVVSYDGPDIAGQQGWSPYFAGLLEFVYFIFDADDELLYVGRSWNPPYRFQVHRRKPWWSAVDRIRILGIVCDRPDEALRRSRLVESLAIREMQPIHNVGAPAIIAERERAALDED